MTVLAVLAAGSAIVLNARAQVSLRQVTLVRDPIVLSIELGFAEDGTATALWRDAVRHRHVDPVLDSLSRSKRPLGPSEQDWHDLIVDRRRAWERMVDSLRTPFGPARPPDSITLLLGMHGGDDAFVFGPATICFDLSRLTKEYGDARSETNRSRIDRFFAHEFTHIVHKAWAREHDVRLETPLDEALWECLTEGVGNYRSLTSRWVGPGGVLTDHARSVLSRLEPVFVDRLSAMSTASREQAAPLMRGLSDGPFNEKWGALTVALWLAQETAWDDRRLAPWIEAGPRGVLDLARRHLSNELRSQLPTGR